MKPEFERTSFSDLLVWYQVSGVLGALLLSRSGGETQLSLISKPEKPLGSICSFNLGQKHSGHLKLSLFCQNAIYRNMKITHRTRIIDGQTDTMTERWDDILLI